MTGSVCLVLALLAMVAPPAPSMAAGAPTPRVGLVLSGGGARGLAHIGVLAVMEELRVPVDYLSGTSMGAIVGALYSAGYSPQEMEAILGQVDWETVFRDDSDRRHESFRRKFDDKLNLLPFEIGIGRDGIRSKPGILAGRKIEFLFRSLTLDTAGAASFDDLPIPFRAVAADLETGNAVVIDRGDLAEAMRASMSLPGIFTPVQRDGMLLVDGGIAKNLPIDVAQGMGAERVIAVNVGTPPKGTQGPLSAFAVYAQTFNVMGKRNVDEQLALLREGDLLITPELEGISAGGFDKIADAIRVGREAASRAEAQLRSFSVSEEEYAAFLKKQRRRPASELPPVMVDAVEIRGPEKTSPRVLETRVKTEAGKPLDLDVLSDDLERVYQAGEFESVGFHVVPDDGGNKLVIEAQEKSSGPGYLQFGLALESNFEGDSQIGIIAEYRRPNVNALGAEWQTFVALGDPAFVRSEFFQPLEPSGFWFVAPRVAAERDRKEIFLVEDEREEIIERHLTGAVDLGVQFRNYGEIRLGPVVGRMDADPYSESGFEEVDRDIGGLRLKMTLDQLDNVFFPTQGMLGDLEVFVSREGFGADDVYERLSFSILQAWTLGRDTIVAALALGTDFGSDIPFYDDFELGGFLNLSGIPRGALQGDVMGLATLADYWRIGRLGPLGRLYLGAAVQAGNVWEDEESIDTGDVIFSGTLFFGLDAEFTPVYLGYGQAEGGENEVYLFIGRPFGR